MKNKSILLFLFLFSFFAIVSCKKKYDSEEETSRMRNKADSLVRIARESYKNKDYIKADDLCNEAITLSMGYPEAVKLKGFIKYDMKDYSGAIELFTIAIDNSGNVPVYGLGEVYITRALAKESLNDYRGALADYDIAIETYSMLYNGYYNRGLLKYNYLDDVNGACSDWSKAGEKGDSRGYELIDKYCNN